MSKYSKLIEAALGGLKNIKYGEETGLPINVVDTTPATIEDDIIFDAMENLYNKEVGQGYKYLDEIDPSKGSSNYLFDVILEARKGNKINLANILDDGVAPVEEISNSLLSVMKNDYKLDPTEIKKLLEVAKQSNNPNYQLFGDLVELNENLNVPTQRTIPDEPIENYFNVLDDLRESGSINMFGAGKYLEEAFGLDKDKAQEILVKWMEKK
jgi:hypothetical protein